MNIYIAASQSCGKTTLARYISKKYNLTLINEVARTVLAEKELNIESLRTDLDIVDDFQKTIFFRQIEEEKKYESFVSDRTFDNLAYAAQHSRILFDIVNTQEFKDYIEKIKTNNSIIFFIRPSKATMKNDGVRETVIWDEIIKIDAMIKLLFKLYNVKYFQIDTDSMQERLMFVDSIIGLVK